MLASHTIQNTRTPSRQSLKHQDGKLVSKTVLVKVSTNDILQDVGLEKQHVYGSNQSHRICLMPLCKCLQVLVIKMKGFYLQGAKHTSFSEWQELAIRVHSGIEAHGMPQSQTHTLQLQFSASSSERQSKMLFTKMSAPEFLAMLDASLVFKE